jgi:hypothetical protein
MALVWRKKVLLAKLETAYGIDPTLTGAANAILAQDVTIRPMEGQDVPRDLIQAYLGGQATIPAELRTVIEFSTELAGSGTAGLAPGWGPLMRGCGCAQVIVADTSVAYNPVSEAMESLYIKYWLDGTLHALRGVRGTATIGLDAQGVPRIRWTFTGIWIPPADVVPVAPTLTGFQKPLIVTDANTPDFTVNAVSLVGRSFNLNLGNQVEHRFLINKHEIEIVDRAEQLDLVCEATPLATFNPFALAEAQTLVPAAIVHGTVPGNIITISAPTCQVRRPTAYQNNQGKVEWPLNLAPLPAGNGNNQFTLTLT